MEGATSAIFPVDACCLAKAYVTAGIARGRAVSSSTQVWYWLVVRIILKQRCLDFSQLGKGPGPVVHTDFPASSRYYPTIALNPHSPKALAFRRMNSHDRTNTDAPTLGTILPIVDTVDWVERLTKTPGITDIQLRIKDETDPDRILERVKLCQNMCHDANIRLWINDYWQAAVKAGCFGVHVGQEDLVKCINAGGLDELIKHNLALGISTHSYGELAAALGVNPSYISLGPVFGTSSKKVAFDPQGLATVAKWRQLIPSHVPLVTIGGIGDAETARQNKEAGADCVAVIGAVTQSEDVAASVLQLNAAMGE
jgi:thiamine-phosphate diphosphorylase